MKLTHPAIREADKPFKVIRSDEFKSRLDSLPVGRYFISVEKFKKNKSLSQLGYLFAVVYPMFMSAAIEAGWELTSLDETEAYCKGLFAAHDLINKHSGEIVKIPLLKRNMTTIEMMTYVDAIRDHCAEYFGVNIPDPDPLWNLKTEKNDA